MGAVRRWTGAQGQIDAMNANAAQQERATKEAARAQAQSLLDAARAAATQQAQMSARSAAEAKAATVASQPLAQADVQIDDGVENSTAARRSRRASYGRNYSSGVSI